MINVKFTQQKDRSQNDKDGPKQKKLRKENDEDIKPDISKKQKSEEEWKKQRSLYKAKKARIIIRYLSFKVNIFCFKY